MSELTIYLLKANVAFVLFYLGYRLLLHNLTFYKLNRYYFLFAFIFSAAYPLVNWVDLFKSKAEIPQEVLSIIPNWQQFQIVNEGINWNKLIEIAFWVTAAVFTFRLLIKLGGILRIHLKSASSRWTIYPYRKSKENIAPFSFWKNIYLNPTKHKEDELDKIFKHEYVHVRQLHSFDILLAETALIFFWYNPICWLLRNAIRENIEYITDKKVLSLGVDKQTYQYSLLNINHFSKETLLGNHFNFKNLKKRIMMMNKKQSANTHLSKYVFIIPAVIIGSLIFGLSNASDNRIIPTILSESPSLNPSNSIQNEFEKTDKKDEKAAEQLIKTDNNPSKKSNTGESKKAKSLIDTLDNAPLNKRELEDLKKGIPVFRFKPDSSGSMKDPLYVIDGKIHTTVDLREIDPNTIESIHVLKGESATSIYGEKGKNGVIKITSKPKKESDNKNNTSITIPSKPAAVENLIENTKTVRGMDKNTLIYIDGKKVEHKVFEDLKSEDIESINVYKDDEAVKRYGKDAKNGVIEVITKSE